MSDDVHVKSLDELLQRVFLDGPADKQVDIVGLYNPAHVRAAQYFYDLGRFLHNNFKGDKK